MKLIEWTDATGPHKVILPDDCDDVTMGAPYGEPWELLVKSVTPEQIAQALREHGIWTIDDLRGNVKNARAALTHLVGMSLSTLLNSVREVHNE